MAIATRDAAPSHLLLKVESVSLHEKREDNKYESPEFVAGDKKWRLVIYPNGHGTEKSGEYVSVSLAISGTDSLPENWEVNAVFSIFILNQISGSYQYTIGNTRRFFRLKTEWGVPNFISKKDLITPSNGYLIDDCCVLGAEVFVIDNIEVVTRFMSLKDEKVPYKHTIKISDYLSTLKGKLVWYSEEFTAGGYKWKIELHPNGKGKETGRSLSIFLMYVPLNSDEIVVKTHYSISMKNQLQGSDKNLECSAPRWFGNSNILWGWPSFISLDELNAPGGGFIMNDTCIFEIQISIQAVAK